MKQEITLRMVRLELLRLLWQGGMLSTLDESPIRASTSEWSGDIRVAYEGRTFDIPRADLLLSLDDISERHIAPFVRLLTWDGPFIEGVLPI